MSKVLVDRELLEQLQENLDPHRDAVLWGEVCDALRRATPAEAEGVSNARLMNTLAELARRAPLRTLHTICETQHQVSTVKLERYLGPIGDTLAGYAFTLRIDFDKISASLSAVTAERDNYKSWYDDAMDASNIAGFAGMSAAQVIDYQDKEIMQLRAEVEGLRKDAERYRWLRDQAPKARGEWEIDGQRYGMMLGADQDDVDEAVDALMSAKAAKEA